MPIYKTATYNVRPDSMETVKNAIREYVAAIKETEPGTTLYVALQDEVNPQRFVHFYAFSDTAAETFHHDAPATKRFSKVLIPSLQGEVAFGDFRLIGTT